MSYEANYSDDVIGTFARHFRCAPGRVEAMLELYAVNGEGQSACRRKKHDVPPGKRFDFDGGKYGLSSAMCADVECFLSQLDRDTMERLGGKDRNYGKGEPQARKAPAPGRGRGEERSHTEYAAEIMGEVRFLTLDDTEEVLFYRDGVYRLGGEVLIKEMAEGKVPECSSHMRSEIINTIRANTYVKRDIFDPDPNVVNVKNGLLDMSTGELGEHSPAYPSRRQVNTAYEPKRTANRFLEFLEQVLHDEEERTVILELFGVALLGGALNLEKIMMFVGEGHNGKSTLLRTMIEVFGRDNVSHISIHDLIWQRFSRSVLDGKLMNVYADISSDELDRMGVVKSLVTGEPITVEKKNKPPYTMASFAKMFFSCNRLPEVKEDSDAIFRRFVIINFHHQFKGAANNIRLFSELTTEEERSGILNLLVRHAIEVRREGKLTYEASTEEMRQTWKERADPVQMFSRHSLKTDVEAHVPKKEAYRAYVEFCRGNNLRPKPARGLTEAMTSLGYVWEDKKVDGKTTNVWVGVRMRREGEEGDGQGAGGGGGPKGKPGTDPVEGFLVRYVRKEEGANTRKDVMYREYRKYCTAEGVEAPTEDGFTMRMNSMGCMWKSEAVGGEKADFWLDLALAGSVGDVKPAEVSSPGGMEAEAGGPAGAERGRKAEELKPPKSIQGPADLREEDMVKADIFMAIFGGLEAAEARRDAIIRELVRSGQFSEDEGYRYVELMLETGKITECDGLYFRKGAKFVCKTCNAGPWEHGAIVSKGLPIEHFHSTHEIEDVG